MATASIGSAGQLNVAQSPTGSAASHSTSPAPLFINHEQVSAQSLRADTASTHAESETPAVSAVPSTDEVMSNAGTPTASDIITAGDCCHVLTLQNL